jgi:hypothetical protein
MQDCDYVGRPILGNDGSSARNSLKGSAEQKLRHLELARQRGGTWHMPLLLWSQSCRENLLPVDVCDVNIFHSSNKLIEFYIFYMFASALVHGHAAGFSDS